MMKFQNIDFQLLTQLEMLLTERHVSRAAANLDISQPAMSAALARLRRLFNDRLLTRTPTGMMPTPRALEIAPHVRQAIMHLEATLTAPAFNPASDRRKFSMSVSELVGPVLLPRLMAMLGDAPRIQFEIWPSLPHTARERLEDGTYDLALGDRELIDGGLHCAEMARQPLCVVGGRANAALLSAGLSLQDYVRLPHAMHLGRAGRATIIERTVDAALSRKGLKRHGRVQVPSLAYAAMVVETSDMLVTMPRPIAADFAKRWKLVLSPPPLPLAQRSIVMSWHARSHTDAGHLWLRQQIRKAFAQSRE